MSDFPRRQQSFVPLQLVIRASIAFYLLAMAGSAYALHRTPGALVNVLLVLLICLLATVVGNHMLKVRQRTDSADHF